MSGPLGVDGRWIAAGALVAAVVAPSFLRGSKSRARPLSELAVTSSDLWLGPDMDRMAEKARVYGGRTAWDFPDIQSSWRRSWDATGLPEEGKAYEDSVFYGVSKKVVDRVFAEPGARFLIELSWMGNLEGILRPTKAQRGSNLHRITSREIGYLLGKRSGLGRVHLVRGERYLPLVDFLATGELP